MTLRSRIARIERLAQSGRDECQYCHGELLLEHKGAVPVVRVCPTCKGETVPYFSVMVEEINRFAERAPRTVEEIAIMFPLPGPPLT